MAVVRRFLSFALLLSISAGAWSAVSWAASGPVTFSADVPAGQTKSVRLNTLPKDAVVVLQVRTDGHILLALLNQQDFKNPAGATRPLFQGETSTSLSFSVTIPAAGDYYLRFENRQGDAARAISVTVKAETGVNEARRDSLARLKTSERTLKAFETRLMLALVFKPVPIAIRACPSPTSFVRSGTLILCADYVRRLHAAFPEGQQVADALLFAMYHEMAHLLLTQWHHPQADQEATADEFATTMMVMFELGAKVRSHAEAWDTKGAVTDQLVEAFSQDPHVLSRARAVAVQHWAGDAELVAKWQALVVPHMQTALLERLTQEPQSWTNLGLVQQELATRKRGKALTF